MVESDESFIEVTGHVDMCFPIGVIPLEGKTAIARARPIEANFVGGTKGGDEIVGVGAVSVAHTEIVNNEAEDDVACVVSP